MPTATGMHRYGAELLFKFFLYLSWARQFDPLPYLFPAVSDVIGGVERRAINWTVSVLFRLGVLQLTVKKEKKGGGRFAEPSDLYKDSQLNNFFFFQSFFTPWVQIRIEADADPGSGSTLYGSTSLLFTSWSVQEACLLCTLYVLSPLPPEVQCSYFLFIDLRILCKFCIITSLWRRFPPFQAYSCRLVEINRLMTIMSRYRTWGMWWMGEAW